MKSRFATALKICIALVLALAIIIPGFRGSISTAQGEVSVKVSFPNDDKNVTTIGGKDYATPNSAFTLNYKITNGSGDNISKVTIEETLYDNNGNPASGTETITWETGIDAGGEKTLGGRRFTGKKDIPSYTIRYKILYMPEGGSELLPVKGGSGEKQISIVSSGIKVTYKANATGQVPIGQEVTYTVELKSTANVNIENIQIKDSVLGLLGEKSLLEPGASASFTKTFKLDKTTNSFPVLTYDDPLNPGKRTEQAAKEAGVEVKVEEKLVDKPLEIVGKANKTTIEPGEEVDFSLSVVNKGNRTLTKVRVVDWTGKEILARDSIAPGREGTVIYTGRIEPGKDYTFKATAVEEGTGRNVESVYTIKFDGLGANIEITNVVTPQDIAKGDMIRIEYTIKNTGQITLVNGVVEEPEFGQVGRFDELKPDQTETFSIEQVIESDTISHPKIFAKAKDTGWDYEFQGNPVDITINIEGTQPLLTIKLSSEPETLEEAGTVDLLCTVTNDGDSKIDNIELILNEREINIGSILSLEPGDQKTITFPGLDIEEDTSFTVTAKGVANDGEEVEFTSDAYEIIIGGEAEEEPVKNPKLVFLKNMLWVLAFLIIATVGGIIYLIRDVKRGGKKGIKIKKKKPAIKG